MDKFDVIFDFLKQHAEDDRKNFEIVHSKLDSLLETRAKFWGAWGSILVISTVVSAVVSFILKPLAGLFIGPR